MQRLITIRVPRIWKEQVNSATVSRWLEEFAGAPYSLPSDPGSGELRINLSLRKRLLSILSKKARGHKGAALRRLIAANLRHPSPRGDISEQCLTELSPKPLIKRTAVSGPAIEQTSEAARSTKPWEHAGGLLYNDELAISPIEQDRSFRGRDKKGVL